MLCNGYSVTDYSFDCLNLPHAGSVSFERVEVEQRGRQAHSDVGWGHLVLLHAGDHLLEEKEEALKSLPVLIRQEVNCCLNPRKLLIFGEVCREIINAE